MLRYPYALLAASLLGALLCSPRATAATAGEPNPPPPQTLPTPAQALEEVIVQTTEPKFVAPTRRDRIGRIWAPVLIDGKGPYRLVLDTGATSSAITTRAALSLGSSASEANTRVTGFTGTALVPAIHVNSMEVGQLLMGPADLPVLSDVFGGAQGVLGIEGLENKRIYADFTRDRLEITLSRGDPPRGDFTVVPLRIEQGLLVADIKVGSVHTRAIIDTGAQATVGNLALRQALIDHYHHPSGRDEIIGVTLDVQTGDQILSPEISFGKVHIAGAHITFGDMYLFQHWNYTSKPTLALGMDLLGSVDVLVIDYNRHEMWIRPH